MKRRQFTKSSALAIASFFLLKCKMQQTVQAASDATGQKVDDFGLQLWSVRDAIATDPIATLKTISNIGYTDVESAGYNGEGFYGLDTKTFKSVLSDMGLTMKSGHCSTGWNAPDQKGTLTNQWEKFLVDHKDIGVSSAVCGYLHEGERQSIDDYKRHADLFNRCAEKAKEYGIKFMHHNHDFEFFPINNQVPYDLLLKETEKDLVNFEMDLYWIKKGNADAFKYFENHPGRFPVWHVKDMDDTEKQFFTEVGSGIIDYVALFRKAEQAGLENFYVEQDAFKNIAPLTSVKQSHDYLKSIEY